MASKQAQEAPAVVQDQLTADLVADKAANLSIEARARRDLMSAESRRKTLHKHYTSEKKQKVSVSPFYRPYFGTVMPVAINGIKIFFPIDGKPHEVPETFAAVILERVANIDAINTKQDSMAEVADNVENAPGALKLF